MDEREKQLAKFSWRDINFLIVIFIIMVPSAMLASRIGKGEQEVISVITFLKGVFIYAYAILLSLILCALLRIETLLRKFWAKYKNR